MSVDARLRRLPGGASTRETQRAVPDVAEDACAPAGSCGVTIAVVIPTVAGREEAFERCLAGVRSQTLPPDEICIVRDAPSYVSAVNEGFRRTSADWIAFLDDDAIPQSDWLATISRYVSDPSIGAIGGRILNFLDGRTSAATYAYGPVAKITWYGRTLSRLHDIPLSRIVDHVDFLPGANMCFRRVACPEVDRRLDRGMAPGFEMALCMAVRRAGWRIIFDSDALVTHYPAKRPQHLSREDLCRASYEYSYLVMYALVKNLAWPRKFAFLAYFLLIGQRASPGLMFAPYFLLPGRSRSRYRAAWTGKLRGLLAAVVGLGRE